VTNTPQPCGQEGLFHSLVARRCSPGNTLATPDPLGTGSNYTAGARRRIRVEAGAAACDDMLLGSHHGHARGRFVGRKGSCGAGLPSAETSGVGHQRQRRFPPPGKPTKLSPSIQPPFMSEASCR